MPERLPRVCMTEDGMEAHMGEGMTGSGMDDDAPVQNLRVQNESATSTVSRVTL